MLRQPTAGHRRDWSWPFWPVVPLYPYGKRRTLRKEIVKDTVWTFDQLQGIFYVVVPIRMTVVKLTAGGLLVYAPVAPTRECVQLVNELVAEHGEVKYIVLPTVTGLEHKVFVGPFARQFPSAQVYVAPGQWSFPLNLPLSWLGFPAKRTQVLPDDSRQTPFAEDFDYQILKPFNLGLGPFSEVAFFHRHTHILLVTDAVVSIPVDPPAIVQLESYPLLFHAKDSASDQPADTLENRRKGWQRIVLFALYFRPDALEDPNWGNVLRNLSQAADKSKRAYFGLFPFQWKAHWQQSFERLRGGGRLLVAPVLQTLIFNRDSKVVLNWVEQVTQWNFQWIIPGHFDAPIAANNQEFYRAFAFLRESALTAGLDSSDLPAEDLALLQTINQQLQKVGVTPPTR
jgi:hypothetical protein